MPCVCEYCHRESDGPQMPDGWDLVMQCYVCGDCLARAKREYPQGGWLYMVEGGEYSDGRPDPRASAEWQARRRALYA